MSFQKQLVQSLIGLGYVQEEAIELAENLLKTRGAVRAALERWVATGVIESNLTVEGYTLQRLIDEFDMNPPAAFLTLDWLTRDPREALSALERGMDVIE